MIPPEIQGGPLDFLDPIVVGMGLGWYAPLLWGLLANLIALAGHYLVEREIVPKLRFWTTAAVLGLLTIHFIELWFLVRHAIYADIDFGPHFLFVYAEGVLCALAWSILLMDSPKLVSWGS